MKPTRLKDVVEIVGIAAIVVSLIFVGLEVRQSAAATRGATQQALADAAREARIEWLVQIEKDRSLKEKFLGQEKIDGNDPLVQEIFKALQAEESFAEVEWG